MREPIIVAESTILIFRVIVSGLFGAVADYSGLVWTMWDYFQTISDCVSLLYRTILHGLAQFEAVPH